MSAVAVDEQVSVAESKPVARPVDASNLPVAGSRVMLRAKRDAWVRIDGSDDATIMNGVIHAGDQVAAPDHGEIKITTANAGALELFVDGRSVGRMGEEGQVYQNLSLDIDHLLSERIRTN